jgi:hypothetical protein
MQPVSLRWIQSCLTHKPGSNALTGFLIRPFSAKAVQSDP